MGLLDFHSQIEMVSEHLSKRFLMANPHGGIFEDLGGRTEARIDAFLDACRDAEKNSERTVWGHKTTTEHVLGLLSPDIAADGFSIRQAFVGRTRSIPTIFILRDGRACIKSKIRRTNQSLATAIQRWRFSVQLLTEYRAQEANLHVLKMEDLVRSPVGCITEVCHFLGLAYEPSMMDGTQNDKIQPAYRRDHFDLSVADFGESEPWFEEIADDLRIAGY